MTGKYVFEIGCYDNATVLPDDEPTVAHYLTNAGYETILSGKMHFVGADQLHGFRRRLTTDIYPADFSWTPGRDEQGNFIRGGHTQYKCIHIHNHPGQLFDLAADPGEWTNLLG